MINKKSVALLITFFVNVAKTIGQIAIPVNENHSSILKISDSLTEPSSFEFKPIKEEFISKQINKLNLKKKQQGVMVFQPKFLN